MGAWARHMRLEGVVLRRRHFGESHRILEMLSAELGRVTLIARGARASRRRFCGALDLFTSLRVNCRSGRDLWLLEQADIVSSRVGIRTSLESVRLASLLCECARALAPEQQTVPGVYRALVDGLDALQEGKHATAVRTLPHMLRSAGICPTAEVCVRCDTRWPKQILLEPTEDGVLCSACAPARPSFPAWAIGAVAGSFEESLGDETTVMTEAETKILEQNLTHWIEAQVGHALKSARAFTRPHQLQSLA